MTKHTIKTVIITVLGTLVALCIALFFFLPKNLNAIKGSLKIIEAYKLIDEKFIDEYDFSTATDNALDAIVESTGDRWSYYLSAEEMESYNDKISNSYYAIGITIEQIDDAIKITAISPESPAERAGITIGDILISVDKQDISGLSTTEIGNLIRGSSLVHLSVKHIDGVIEEYSLKPEKIKTTTVELSIVDDIGYLKIYNFFSGVADDFIQCVEDAKNQNVKALVFDVRFNGGGYVNQLTKMLDYLLPEGIIFHTYDNDGIEKITESDSNHIELPMAVLVNDQTFSAAEYFAEALREYNAAQIVGQKTTGKGHAQTMFTLSDGSGINISTLKYYTPDGFYLTDIGVTPDFSVDLSEDYYILLYYKKLEFEKDTQLTAAFNLFS